MVIEASPVRSSGAQGESPLQDALRPIQPHTLETQVGVLQSGPIRAKALERIQPYPPEAAPSLQVAQVSSTNIIEVMAESTDPRVARDAANALVSEYISQSTDVKGALLRKTRLYVEQKLTEAQRQLAAAEARLRSFKEQNQLPELASNRASALGEAASLREELRSGENDLAGLQAQMRTVRRQLNREPGLVQATKNIVSNPEVAQLQENLQRLDLQRISLLRIYKPAEPEVREVDQQIQRLQQRLRQLPATVQSGVVMQPNPARSALMARLNELDAQVKGLAPRVERLRRQQAQSQDRLQAFPALEAKLVQLERERDEAQESQKEFSSQLRTLQIREQALGVTARPLEEANQPSSPVRPRRVLNLVAALALGLVFGVGAACLREMMDDRIHTTADVERFGGLQVLGRVPALPRNSSRLIPAEGESPMKDSYRRLRASISFASQTAPIRSLIVTSPTAAEGKSTIAANLAIATALQGLRVILVDGDLRNPSLSKLFNVASEPGLSNVLTGQTTAAAALHSTELRDLLLLPAGSPLSNAAEWLAQPRMGELVQELSGLADLVILDTPPCVPMADAEVLGSQVDAAVLVVALGQTDRAAVHRARELLDHAHVRLLGTVMNRVKSKDYLYHYRYSDRSTLSLPIPSRSATAVIPQAAETAASGGSEQQEERA